MGITRHPLSANSAKLSRFPVDLALVARLEASHALMREKCGVLADRFYDRLFSARPDLRALFPADMSTQKQRVLTAIHFIVKNLREPEVVQDDLRKLGERHKAYGVRDEHYPPVCRALVEAMADACGPSWTAELQAEWSRAIELVAEAMRAGAARPGEPA